MNIFDLPKDKTTMTTEEARSYGLVWATDDVVRISDFITGQYREFTITDCCMKNFNPNPNAPARAFPN